MKSLEEKIQILANKIKESGSVTFFTGAGISTESGIPDYRSKGGIWEKFQPVYFDEFLASKSKRELYWKRKVEFYNDLMKAYPNDAHNAIAEIDKLGYLDCIITQNIDGLHQKAGVPDDKVIEIHGTNLKARCLSCDKVVPIQDTHKIIEETKEFEPKCDCGGFYKPDTISFGQMLNEKVLENALIKSSNSKIFITIGSTLLVQPAASMPYYAMRNGAFLVILNLSETPFDSSCDVLINEKAGYAMKLLLHKLTTNN